MPIFISLQYFIKKQIEFNEGEYANLLKLNQEYEFVLSSTAHVPRRVIKRGLLLPRVTLQPLFNVSLSPHMASHVTSNNDDTNNLRNANPTNEFRVEDVLHVTDTINCPFP